MVSTITDRLTGLNTDVAIKAPVKAATTANITLSGEQTLDGTSCVEDDRVLVKDQTDATENGIYVVKAGAWERADDFAGSFDVAGGTIVAVTNYTSNTNAYWVDGSGVKTVGTDAITFSPFSVGAVGGTPVVLTGLNTNDFLYYDGTNLANLDAAAARAILSLLISQGSNIASATTTDIGAGDSDFVTVTGTTTIAGLGSGSVYKHVWVKFSGVLTLTHNGTSLILPTAANITTAAGDMAEFINISGSNWQCVNYSRADGSSLVDADTGISDVVEDTTPQLGGMLDVNGNSIGDGTLELLKFSETGGAVNEFTIANAATGSAPELQATGDDTNIGITLSPKGTGNITLGTVVIDADQSLGAGQDNYVFTYDNGSGTASFEAATGGSGGITLGTEQATTSGTAFDFTSIPSGTKRIIVNFYAVSLSGTDDIIVQLGDSGGVETTGYASVAGAGASSPVTSTAGFRMWANIATASWSGQMILTRVDSAGTKWVSSHTGSTGTADARGGGSKTLSAELDRVRITVETSNTFDAGSVNITYE